MRRTWILSLLLPCALLSLARADVSAASIIDNVLRTDPWGLSDARVKVRVTLTDKSGGKRNLAFEAKSRQYDAPLSKSLVRFSSPPDLAGAGFLQVQKKDGDDDRFLFLPELKRSRRISGDLRSSSFMGTDLTFADLDRRDLRESKSALKGEATLAGKWPCHLLEVKPQRGDSQYSRMELWVRKDNYLPVKGMMYDRSGSLLKTLEALEVKRVGGKWFISRSRITNHQQSHVTELVLEDIQNDTTVADEEFSVRALEKS
jgi:outer membrane lipoprotein-sorting protein